MDFKLSKREALLNITIIILIILIMGRLFYGTFVAGISMLPLAFPLYRQRKKKITDKRVSKFEHQFRDMLISVSDALSTGYSMENAIRESYRDLVNIYGDDSDICKELRLMISRIKLNVNVETVIEDFARRSTLKNAKMFAEIFSVAKKTGGNMTSIIKSVTDDIVLKEMVEEEISVAINEKKTEQKVMTVIPMFLIIYVSVTSSGFLDVMYQTWMGRIVMTICIAGYIGAYIWAEKITSIKV